eukprot:m.208713 g.208713  ORF g.208713 m.208713 type:complete len:462 (-) comp33020_c2_seq2:180-1565(-)
MESNSTQGDGHLDRKEQHSITAIVIGAGRRAEIYTSHPAFKVVGVADPSASRRLRFQRRFGIDDSNVWADWSEAFGENGSKHADVAIITTPDQLHVQPVLAAIAKGYHVLMEKPMATTLEDCESIAAAAAKSNSVCAVCHVLRYTPANRRMRQLIESGKIGEVVSITHTEPVGHFHFAHSFVRGQWSQEASSTFLLMSKSCHDIDLLLYFMGDNGVGGDACTSVSSFGSLQHFKQSKKPAAAKDATRCLDCAHEQACPYSAPRLYIKKDSNTPGNWAHALTEDVPDIENVMHALRNGPYGVCVYESKNDVVDHQVVNMEFKSGATASFSMVSVTDRLCQRETKIYGSLGELSSDDELTVRHKNFVTGDVEMFAETIPPGVGTDLKGHGGADFYCITAFVEAVIAKDKTKVLTDPINSLRSHTVVYAAETARKERRIVNVLTPKSKLEQTITSPPIQGGSQK